MTYEEEWRLIETTYTDPPGINTPNASARFASWQWASWDQFYPAGLENNSEAYYIAERLGFEAVLEDIYLAACDKFYELTENPSLREE